MPLPQYPDAVIFPKGKVKGPPVQQHEKIRKIFGPVLNCQKVWTKDQKSFNFTHPNVREDGTVAPVDASLLFPIGHRLEKSERYDWYLATQDKVTGKWTVDETKRYRHADELDKVKFGFLKSDVAPDDDDGLVTPDEVKVDAAAVNAATTSAPAFRAPAPPPSPSVEA